MTFDPFSAIPQPPSDQGAVPATSNPPAQNPFMAPEDDDDEIHFDLTGESGVASPQPSTAPSMEPELRVELTPIPTPSVPTPIDAPSFSAPWEVPTPASVAVEPSNSFSLDIATPANTPGTTITTPVSTAGGLVGLFDRLVNMIEEETRTFESSQKKHQANIANEQRLIEEETMAFGKKKADILQGLEDLKKRLAS